PASPTTPGQDAAAPEPASGELGHSGADAPSADLGHSGADVAEADARAAVQEDVDATVAHGAGPDAGEDAAGQVTKDAQAPEPAEGVAPAGGVAAAEESADDTDATVAEEDDAGG